MLRIVKEIDPEAASRIAGVLTWPTELNSTSSSTTFDLVQGPYDYEVGFQKLRQVIIGEEGAGTDIHLQLEAHRSQLVRALDELRLAPAAPSAETENKIERVLRELDRLAYQYLQKTFRDLSIVDVRNRTVEDKGAIDPYDRLLQIREEIRSIEKKLHILESKKIAQAETGDTSTLLEKELAKTQEALLRSQQEESELLHKHAPGTFLSVVRTVGGKKSITIVEEQPIEVHVTIENKGRKPAMVSYKERLPGTFVIIDGASELTSLITPSGLVHLRYSGYVHGAGIIQFDIDAVKYAGQVPSWDEAEPTHIEVKSGEEPLLTLVRKYQFDEQGQGIRIFVQLENTGDKIAENVHYSEAITYGAGGESISLEWSGSIWGKESVSVEELIPELNPQLVRFAPEVTVSYSSREGIAKFAILKPRMERIEYRFPVSTDAHAMTVGRSTERKLIRQIVDGICNNESPSDASSPKRLLVIRGLEGTGKTRLAYELVEAARKKSMNVYIQPSQSRTPIRLILCQLLGVELGADDQTILRALQVKLPEQNYSMRREILFAFLSRSSNYLTTNEDMARLEGHVVSTIYTLCRIQPTLLVFEDIHFVLEGAEARLLTALLQSVLINQHNPLLICVTYRPSEREGKALVDKAKIPMQYCDIVELGALTETDVGELVNAIIPFPRFSAELINQISAWSRNPLYIIEHLRLLTHPDSQLLERVGGRWLPSQTWRNADLPHKEIEHVIRQRIDLELPQVSNLARALAAIGFELPERLVRLYLDSIPDYLSPAIQRDAIPEMMQTLVDAGILTSNGQGDFQFEHQLKREVIYNSIPSQWKTILRERLAQLLLENRLFPDPHEQTRQLARHIVKSSIEYQRQHVEELTNAAAFEASQRSIERALEFYDVAITIFSTDAGEGPDRFVRNMKLSWLLLQRARLHEMLGHLFPSNTDLEQAYRLVAPQSPTDRSSPRKAQRQRAGIRKQQARVILRQTNGALDKANEHLLYARVSLEGNLGLRRIFLPNDPEFCRDLVEIYLDLGEVFLRKRNFGFCEKACRRAARIARQSNKRWPNDGLLAEVYRKLGNLHAERGTKEDEFKVAVSWYNSALELAGSDPFTQERIWLRLADLYDKMGNRDSAYETYINAIRVQEQLGDEYGLALSFGGLGNLCVESDDFEHGRYYCEKAIAYQQEIGDLNRYWRTCISLVRIYLNINNWRDAVRYWNMAEPILFKTRHFTNLSTRKQREIYELCLKLRDYFREQGNLDDLRACLLEIDFMVPFIFSGHDDIARVRLEYGEVCFETQRWDEAISAFENVLSEATSAELQAIACEYLGDVYAARSSRIDVVSTQPSVRDTILSQAEVHYEDAVKRFLRLSDELRAYRAYEKLLYRIIDDPDGLLQLPFIFLRIFQSVPPAIAGDKFVEIASDRLMRNKLPRDAGDIYAYAARECARRGNQPEAQSYLGHAEDTYLQGDLEDQLWGWYMVIPTYYRLGRWEEITRCFEQIFDVSIGLGNAAEFLDALGGLHELSHNLSVEEQKRLTDSAIEKQRKLDMLPDQSTRFQLLVAKHYSDMAGRVDDPAEEMTYQDEALRYYAYILEQSPDASSISAVALNDSALIHRQRGEMDRALEDFNKSIRISRMVGNNGPGFAVGLHNRAHSLLMLGRKQEAWEDLDEAYDIGRASMRQWEARLANVDDSPLTAGEVIEMHYAKDAHMKICLTLLSQALASGNGARVSELIIEHNKLTQELSGRPQKRLASAGLFLGGTLPDGISLPEDVLIGFDPR